VLFSVLNVPSLETEYQEQSVRVLERIDELDPKGASGRAALADLADLEPSLLMEQRDGPTLFSRYENDLYDSEYGPTDYGYGERGDLRAFFDLMPLNQEQSRTNLLYFVIIVLIVLAFMFYYSPHFALTISDPIHIMRRGMSEKGYNLEIRIPPLYEEDEVYRLGQLFNEVYLPLKDRTSAADEAEVLDLKLDDIKDILNE
jgi:hypothetical protein